MVAGSTEVGTEQRMLVESPLFQDMLPTFMDTASHHFCYHFYIAYDYNDVVLSLQAGRDAFIYSFAQVFNSSAAFSEVEELDLTFVWCKSWSKILFIQQLTSKRHHVNIMSVNSTSI